MRGRLIPILAAVALTVLTAACNRTGTPELTTTSSLAAGGGLDTTTVATSTTTGAAETTTTVGGQAVKSYEIMYRSADNNGEHLFVLIPPGSYNDIDLQNFIGDLMEKNKDIYELQIFDDAAALAAARKPEAQRTSADQALLDQHFLVSVEQGQLIKYQGPYARYGQMVLGS